MEGLLLIADITGYTAFLQESELEHAEDSLRSLLNLLLEQTGPPLVISRLQGDAVISYAPAWQVIRRFARRDITEGFQKFHATVDKELAQAAPAVDNPPDIVPQQVEEAVAQSLRG